MKYQKYIKSMRCKALCLVSVYVRGGKHMAWGPELARQFKPLDAFGKCDEADRKLLKIFFRNFTVFPRDIAIHTIPKYEY